MAATSTHDPGTPATLPGFPPDLFQFDVSTRLPPLAAALKAFLAHRLHRRGVVVAVSGGIDSAACLALCVRAIGPERVLALFLPERDSSPDSLRLGTLLAETMGVRSATEDISPVLQGARCYERRDDAIRSVFAEYGAGWRSKITIPSILAGERLNVSRLVVEAPDGRVMSARMPAAAYLQLVAATNFKQRVRTMTTYYHADQQHYAVCGTPNRLEYDQGFFVKGGDGLADFKPIAHLYKTEVYSLAYALGVPEEICLREPTTDTFSMSQTQEEFYFSVPYRVMDLCLYGHNHDLPPGVVSDATGLTVDQVERVFADIEAKRRATRPLHIVSQLLEPVPEIDVHGLAESTSQ